MSESILRVGLLEGLGLRHGFTTRRGGTSRGAWESNNLSDKVGDDLAAVAANRRRWEEASGLTWGRLVGLNQVHGTDSLLVDRPAAELSPEEQRSFDAALTNRDDVVLGVRTADCVPILLACDEPRAVAAVHAGWRGTLGGIAGIVAARMEQAFGCDPGRLSAVIGPCISSDRFEVGPEVFQPFLDRLGAEVAKRDGDRLTVDLSGANRASLLAAGLVPERVVQLGLCTHERDDLFFSHRRDRGITGRQMAFISLGS